MHTDTQIDKEASTLAFIEGWEKFYKLLGLRVGDLSNISIPQRAAEHRHFNRLIITHGDLTYSRLANICRSEFHISFPYENMEIATRDREERFPRHRTAVWVRDSREADRKNARKSWRELRSNDDLGINLREYIIFHLKYFLEKEKHPDDRKTATLCSGTLFKNFQTCYAYFDVEANTLVIKECGVDFSGKHQDREVRSRSIIEREVDHV